MPNSPSDPSATVSSRTDETTSFLRALLDATPGLVLLAQSDGQVVYFNQAVAEATGWEQSAHQAGYQLRSLVAPETALRLLDHENVGPVRAPLQSEKGNGEVIVEWSTRILESQTNPRILVAGRDITREQELENYVASNQWYETMGALSGGLAHDFNNILAAILGLSEIIALRLPKDDPLQPFSQKICGAVERAKGLVSRFSQFSRKPAMLCEPQPTAMVVTQLSTLIQGFLTGSISLDTAIAEETPWCETDRHVLEQILLNCANFFRTKLRDAGGQCLLSSRPSKNGRHALVEFRGSGEGLLGIRTETLFDLNLDTGTVAYESGTALFSARHLAVETRSLLYARRDDPRTITFVLEVPTSD